jgi:hypothetical protein
MKTGIIIVLFAAVAVLFAVILATGHTPAKARTPADPPPSYAVTAQLGCAYYPGGGGIRAWIPGPCTDATGTVADGEPDAYRLTVTNTGRLAEPVPDVTVTVGYYGVTGLIATARENLGGGQIAPGRAVGRILQDQPPGTTGIKVLGTSRR